MAHPIRAVSLEHAPFALGRFAADGEAFTAVVRATSPSRSPAVDGGLDDALPPTAVLARWEELGDVLARGAAPADGVPISGLRRLAPVEPRQVFAAGLNYRTHVIDLMVDQRVGSRPGMDVEEIRAEATAIMDERARSGVPFVWVGLPSSLCGPDDDIVLQGEQSDWELELAAVIGRPARGLEPEEALSCVAGWTVANDITARDLVPRTDLGAVGADWLRSKCAPTYKPVGPYLVPAAFVDDPQDLRIELRLNGELMQDETTADMIFDAATLVAFVSQHAQLLPGDLLLTGSPAGNGSHYDRWLRRGDVMEGSITGLGTQRNHVVASARR